jgi:NAD(P)-dependent dehydrogenase (short-subunit alcohol dehydrogenase family)
MHGKRVVIVGGSSGLGLAAAKAVGAAGGTAVITSRSRGGLERGLSRLSMGADGHVADITNETEVRALFDRVGAFDHLVYTAAEPLLSTTLAETAIDDARRFLETRFFGALTTVKYASPHLRPGGSIVLTGGTASTRPVRGTTVVASVLAAIEGLTRALAVELAPIRVNAVVPGIIRTEMWSGLPEADRLAMYRAVEEKLLVGPRVGEPGDVAETYLYLMRSRHTTGTTITIDGGDTLT